MNLMARFSSMLDKFQSRDSNTSCSDSSAVLGQSASNTEPDRTKCPTGLRFRNGREDQVPQEDIIDCDSVTDETPETPRHPPGDAGEPQGRRSAPAFVRHHQAGAGFESQPDDDDDDDRDSGTDSAPSDKTYIRLMHYIHDRFPHSEPASAPREPPRCEFAEFFSTSEASSSAKPTLTLYPRVDEILYSCADRAARFAKESKPLYRVLPFKRKSTPVGIRPDFCVARYVNSDFSRIARQKMILKSRASSVSLSDLEKLDRASRSLIAGQSQSFWLLSSLLAQLRDEEFKPADPNLFDKTITTLSASLASQTNLSSGISEFVTSKRRGSYLAHTSCPVGESVKRELLVAPGTDNLLLFRTKDLPSFINNRLSSRSSECTAARFKYPANRPGGGGRYSLPLRAVSSPRHSPLSSQPEWTCVA